MPLFDRKKKRRKGQRDEDGGNEDAGGAGEVDYALSDMDGREGEWPELDMPLESGKFNKYNGTV